MKIKVQAIFCTDISQISSSRAEYFTEEIVITLFLLLHYISVVNKIGREFIHCQLRCKSIGFANANSAVR